MEIQLRPNISADGALSCGRDAQMPASGLSDAMLRRRLGGEMDRIGSSSRRHAVWGKKEAQAVLV